VPGTATGIMPLLAKANQIPSTKKLVDALKAKGMSVNLNARLADNIEPWAEFVRQSGFPELTLTDTTEKGIRNAYQRLTAVEQQELSAMIDRASRQPGIASTTETLEEIDNLVAAAKAGSLDDVVLTPIQKQFLSQALDDDAIRLRHFLSRQALKDLGNPEILSDAVTRAKKFSSRQISRELPVIADNIKNQKKGLLAQAEEAAGEGKAGVKVGKVSDSGKLFLKKAGLALAPIAAVMMFNVNVKPVRAELEYSLINHYVVSRTKDETLHTYCYRDAEGKCAETGAVPLASVCPDTASGCAKLRPANEIVGVQGYSLFVSMNDDKLRGKQKNLFTSIFDPNEPPFASTDKDVSDALGRFELEAEARK